MAYERKEYLNKYRAVLRAKEMLEETGLIVEKFDVKTTGLDLMAHNSERVGMIRVEVLEEENKIDYERLRMEMHTLEVPDNVTLELWIWSPYQGFSVEVINRKD
jgi:hypothetical protein